MRAVLKRIMPLALRVRLKQWGYVVMDRIDPITTPRVPPRAQTFIGGGDFVTVGDDFFKTLKRHDLKPTDCVLDVGCGQGRMARPLIEYLDGGQYQGLDISASGIAWCDTHYADLPDFQFLHMDVYNSRYNETGRQQAADYVFPVKDNSQDMIFLTSVFTHMLAKDIEAYLLEFSRILKPGGKVLISWYLLDDINQYLSRKAVSSALDFRYKFDNVSRTTVRATPEAAIAFEKGFVTRIYEKAGLDIIGLEEGSWAKPKSGFMLQDLIIAQKPLT